MLSTVKIVLCLIICLFDISNFACQLERDQGFKEFLSVHQNRGQAPTWANDTIHTPGPDSGQTKNQGKKKLASDDYLNFDSDNSDDEDEEDEREKDECG